MRETRETRLKRLRMRSWRRGMKEMDLIFGAWADGPMAALDDAGLDAYERVMDENDQDLYLWLTARISGREDRGPAELAPMLDQIATFAAGKLHG
ncbi:MAG: succinate dehydrogenase assembly factor 2 [Paracoccus sp. (in: a-proteobacteria)]|uniref:FAD assembly factor SdhE n=1 Tax=Paracoccus sp. TaxID=267 RepID=UPI0026DF34CD|nr:succinate dehydrogenase assembly factor 2 [Paracoccus sp. (in: a-proteobacteria)]MDO5620771.1 succinate dehydrogenase assembly factor 2 [Paracoccus sp. (in: a-proteobacteria)]